MDPTTTQKNAPVIDALRQRNDIESKFGAFLE